MLKKVNHIFGAPAGLAKSNRFAMAAIKEQGCLPLNTRRRAQRRRIFVDAGKPETSRFVTVRTTIEDGRPGVLALLGRRSPPFDVGVVCWRVYDCQ
jgi:hypothetical protein